MKLPIKWLNDYTEMREDINTFCHKMTLSGSKVESFESESDRVKNVVCARVLSLSKHPDSDHLWICQMDIGGSEPSQIVTGAQNLKVGDLVPAALPGASLPNGMEIQPTVMRGVQSNGMLCSMGELGLTVHDCPGAVENGILVLSDEYGAKPGDDLCKVMGFDDKVVDFEITPNRPDCLSITGLARESAATFGKPLTLPEPTVKETHGNVSDYISVELKTPLCPRYTGAVVTDIKIAPSPKFIRDRLRTAGVRPINNIVDITNFVMLEYGQPMHAFDYSCIEGKKIIVRTTKEGETSETLDGQSRKLAPGTIVICDERKIIGLAGVMGGLNSEITENTNTVVFESANFNAPAVRVGARNAGIRTEASSRYEKGLDCENTYPALLRALQLVEELSAGKVVGGIVDEYPVKKPVRTIKLEPERICAFIGADISEEEMVRILTKLGFRVENGLITVPSYRDDVEGFADIAEEVARFYGYDKIKPTLFAGTTTQGGLSARQKFERDLSEYCRAAGFYEICTLSFMSPKAFDKLALPENDPLRRAVVITNPLGEDQSLMRTSALPSTLEVIARNVNFRAEKVKFFEPATVYVPTLDENGRVDPSKLANERKILVLSEYGNGDFFALKGEIEEILSACKVISYEIVPKTDVPYYHCGRCAEIISEGRQLGVFGQIHPTVAKNFGVDCEVYCAELVLDEIEKSAQANKIYKSLPKYPAVTRDIALVCSDSLYSLDLERVIKKAAGDDLYSLSLFDVYKGAQTGVGKKSLAYTLSLRHPDRTLTDKEADEILARVLKALESELSVTLRA